MNEVGSSNINANVNGSVTPVDFEFKPGPNEVYVLDRILFYGLGTTNVTSTSYVDLVALTNGVEITLNNSAGIVSNVTNDLPLKTNDDICNLCYDSRQNLFGANPRSISARYSFFKETGFRGILLDGTNGEKLIITINDNLTALVSHRFKAGAFKL
jgi:hypothetical protein